ncbi:hypothetical protein Cfor_06227 [Coptotermes formosanus]|uniref:Uncharacterized protein n=1 Tax=Coptotermes formosanus TaxID=36987 RepID=A0A6L2PAL1_COPFO|nr:hypothetical protein Cfor_06227 [Coptotermes formosanus]
MNWPCYAIQQSQFLQGTLTGSEIWINHVTAQVKRASMLWGLPFSTSKRFPATSSVKKTTATVFDHGKHCNSALL